MKYNRIIKLIIFMRNYSRGRKWLFSNYSFSQQFAVIQDEGWNSFLELVKTSVIQNNYQNVLKKLNKVSKQRKIRVCFLVNETSKWNMQEFHDKLLESSVFEPYVLVSNFNDWEKRTPYDHLYRFYKGCSPNALKAWNEDTHTTIDIQQFSPDIIFYQQPWGISNNQNITYASKFAITFYISYAIEDAGNAINTHLNFYLRLYRLLVFSSSTKDFIIDYTHGMLPNIKVTGHPKLEVYKDYSAKGYIHKYVIYAPHHTFYGNSNKYGTFLWSGKYMLEWAKEHPEFKWVFKPHPRLRIALSESGYMSKEEINDYYEEWAKIGLIYEDGNYFSLFKESKCMITDCGSFLTEYLPTEMPVIHLRNHDSDTYTATNSIIIESYYKAYCVSEFENLLYKLLIKGEDTMKQERIKLIHNLNLDKFDASTNIINLLEKDIIKQ